RIGNRSVVPRRFVHGREGEAQIPSGQALLDVRKNARVRQVGLEDKLVSGVGVGFWSELRSLRVIHFANGKRFGREAFGLVAGFRGAVSTIDRVLDIPAIGVRGEELVGRSGLRSWRK